ncbi:hypothetical protein F4777DRAFT_377946 [Nemania sp. FL0916]|nr:hypothetical protein F4777DRAFT_377946 [Nemania sp. FL0916]
MHCYTAHALLAISLVSQASCGSIHEKYRPSLARMSTRNILGLHRRVIEGYSPTEHICGVGDTCAEACGKGFRQCASKDGAAHCYNYLEKQTCCPGGSGDSCDNGYFCTADEKGTTWCCPDGLSLKQCAQKYSIPGPLTSQAPSPRTTTTHSKTSPIDPTHTRSKSENSGNTETITTPKVGQPTSTSKSELEETNTSASLAATTTLLIDVSSIISPTDTSAAQTTTLNSASESMPFTSLSAPSPSSTSGHGNSIHGPTHGLVLLIAAALAALI